MLSYIKKFKLVCWLVLLVNIQANAKHLFYAGKTPKADCIKYINSNTTWLAGLHSVTCTIIIDNNAVLTIKEGAIIKFSSTGKLSTTNGGAINAPGTIGKPIIFTGVQSTSGFWPGIDILTNSRNNVFKYCQFKYAGLGSRSMVYVGDGTSENIGRAEFQNCIFSNGLKNGLYLAYNSFIDSSVNNTFTSNAQYPVSTTLESVSQLSASNVYTGNGNDCIYVNSDYQCSANVHFQKIDVPYYLTATSNNRFDIYGNWIIDPGVTLALGANMELNITNGGGNAGTFNCVGDSLNPITIKGYQSVQGFWDKICFNGSTGSTNQIVYTNIQDGGSYAHEIWNDKGMITLINTVYGGNTLRLEHSNISNSLHYGVFILSSSTENINGKTGVGKIQNALSNAKLSITNCADGAIYIN